MMRALLSCAALALASAQQIQYTHDQLANEITNLPNLPAGATFKMFSGYIKVSDSGPERKLFYWFTESQGNPTTDPVILWSNGGPGCSGLGGFMTEQGPFRPTVNGSGLVMNPQAWNKLASMVFIEQPAGVGFSTNADKNFKYGDTQAADDNYRFVVEFFKLYPQFAKNSFYTTSESYGGHYMPTLAQQLVKQGGVPNYKGFMVGNPLTYMPYRNYGQYGTYAGHNLLPAPLWKEFTDNKCQEIDAPNVCDKILDQCDKLTSGMDPYALDFPICVGSPGPGDKNLKAGRNERYAFTRKIHQARDAARAMLGRSGRDSVKSSGYFPTKYSPCDSDYGHAYLNRADVQAAIHVEGSNVKWSDCSDIVGNAYSNDDVNAPMMPVYQYLLNQTKQPLDIMIMSGDDDSICATTGTQQFIWDLGYDVKTKWAPWLLNKQVAGFTALFDTPKGGNTFRFSTVHGAGHMVPSTRPEQSLELLRKYLKQDF